MQYLSHVHACMHDHRTAGDPYFGVTLKCALLGEGSVEALKAVLSPAEPYMQVGYPILLKATGGGGGMGIYICHNQQDVERQFEMSQKQGAAFFGNDGVRREYA